MISNSVKPALRDVLIFMTSFSPFFHDVNLATSRLFMNSALLNRLLRLPYA
jgi:hypothetical protein